VLARERGEEEQPHLSVALDEALGHGGDDGLEARAERRGAGARGGGRGGGRARGARGGERLGLRLLRRVLQVLELGGDARLALLKGARRGCGRGRRAAGVSAGAAGAAGEGCATKSTRSIAQSASATALHACSDGRRRGPAPRAARAGARPRGASAAGAAPTLALNVDIAGDGCGALCRARPPETGRSVAGDWLGSWAPPARRELNLEREREENSVSSKGVHGQHAKGR
jgi:hypothetical protein